MSIQFPTLRHCNWLSLVVTLWLTLAIPTIAHCADLDDLISSGQVERVATGFGFTEGPVWIPAGYLLFSDIPNSSIIKWSPDGTTQKFRNPSAKSNGLTLDREGRLIACEHGTRRVSRTETDGTVVALAERYDGKRLNSPNDVIVKSDGSIYFTDPPYGLLGHNPHIDQTEPGEMELTFSGVYMISPDGNSLTLLTKDLSMPNGLAFSPDERVLYVADTQSHQIHIYDVRQVGTLENDRVFIQMPYDYPDGIKVDANGNLYVSTNTPKGVKVFDSSGKFIGSIKAKGYFPANCAFGGPDNKSLFITAEDSVYMVKMKVPGARTVGR
jgi:gluconolactonase